MDIVLATSNKNKIREFQNIVSEIAPELNLNIISMADAGIADTAVEDGATFEENAMIKAKCAAGKYICFADDSGICVDALGGAPGIYSARYSGVHGDNDANNAKLLDEMKDVPDGKRTARYVCAIACVMPDGRSFCVTGKAEGKIAHALEGNGGFGYDPLFIGEENGASWGKITQKEKDAISHRMKASQMFITKLKDYLQ